MYQDVEVCRSLEAFEYVPISKLSFWITLERQLNQMNKIHLAVNLHPGFDCNSQSSFRNIGQEVYATPRNKDRGLGMCTLSVQSPECKTDMGVTAKRLAIVLLV